VAPIDLRVNAGAYRLEQTVPHVLGRVDDPDEGGAAHEAGRRWTEGGAGLGQVLVGRALRLRYPEQAGVQPYINTVDFLQRSLGNICQEH
jgi:hypothetical protein